MLADDPASGSFALGDVAVEIGDDHVATVELRRPPDNFFDPVLISDLVDALTRLDGDARCRAVVLCSVGKNFCAGADFSGRAREQSEHGAAFSVERLYDAAARLFATQLPIVAAVQGAAVGGGLGVACAADFRVATESSRFAANFARLGFHHGFGLTVTLPAIVGSQRALELLYTGRRIRGEEAHAIGLADRLVSEDRLRDEARELAFEIAQSAPLAVRSIRATMRGHMVDAVRAATAHELREQARLRQTADWAEGVRAAAERRAPQFRGE